MDCCSERSGHHTNTHSETKKRLCDHVTICGCIYLCLSFSWCLRLRCCSTCTIWLKLALPCLHWATIACFSVTIATRCQSICLEVSWYLYPLMILFSSILPRSVNKHTCIKKTMSKLTCVCFHSGASDGGVQHRSSSVETEFLRHVWTGKKQCPHEWIFTQGKLDNCKVGCFNMKVYMSLDALIHPGHPEFKWRHPDSWIFFQMKKNRPFFSI